MEITPIIHKVPKKNLRWLYRFGLWWANWLSTQIMFFGVWIQKISSNEVVEEIDVDELLKKWKAVWGEKSDDS